MTMFRLGRRARDGERGATAIMVAMALLLLMGFAAIAVDAGIAYSERRQQSSASDVGSLAALQFARTSLGTPAVCTGLVGKDLAACRGAVEALDVIDGTVPGRYTSADWTACTDPDDDSLGYTQDSHLSDCISFTANLQRSRVVLPGTDVDTAFAAPLGFDSVGVDAFAEAGLELDIVGGVLPFAIGPSGSGSDQACFTAGDTANDNLDISPCASGTEGNYGKLNLRLYGNENYGTPTICSGSNAERMSTNIAAGSDHPLEPASKSPGTIVNDVTNCSDITNPVDQVETWTGNAQGAISDGLIFGTSNPTLEGRMLCKDGSEVYPLGTFNSRDCERINNNHPQEFDHTPLWDYINPGANSEAQGGGCDPGAWTKKGRDKMQQCLANWKAWPGSHTTSLFTEDILESPRFAGIPILNSDPGGGTGSYLITKFQPVYLETIYLGCNGVTCSTVHSPGEASTGSCPSPITAADWSCGWPGNGNKIFEAMTAFTLTLDMLPDSIAEKFPYQDGTIVYNLYK